MKTLMNCNENFHYGSLKFSLRLYIVIIMVQFLDWEGLIGRGLMGDLGPFLMNRNGP